MDKLIQQLQIEVDYAGKPLSSDDLQHRLTQLELKIADATRVLRYQNKAVFTDNRFKSTT